MLIEPHWRFGPEFGEKELEKPHFTFHSTLLRMAAHAFSHCDAPFHVSPDMETIDEMGLDRFFGPARMVDVSGHGDRAALGEKELREGGAAALQPGEIALIRSDHELRHPTTTPQYWVDSPWITAGEARFLLDCGIKAVGFDFPQDRGIREDYDPDFVPSTDPVEDWAWAMSRRRSNMGLAGEQSSECLGGREIAQSAAGSIVDLLGDGGE
ncbi:cyclase family protein, partial [Propionibacterium freudenreichii]|uniref:cyclase family protein n=1 Tax=Propionibacterium freudenreichii TaxID=1744 RepID=UPI0025513AF9